MLLFAATLVAYFAAALICHLGTVTKKKPVAVWGYRLLIAAVVLHGCVVLKRWIAAGQPPMVYLYDLMLVYGWLVVAVSLAVSTRFLVQWLRPISAAIGALCMASTSFMDDSIRPLVPALQSNWLTIHVASSFISYAGFTVSFVLGLAFVLKQLRSRDTSGSDALAKRYEDLMYRCVLFSFPILTIGIVTGSIWAKSAWGRYWGWDPKEVWSLITWLIYAIYLHLRRRPLWRGKPAVILNILGFTSVLFTWFGVNYLLYGLHNYK